MRPGSSVGVEWLKRALFQFTRSDKEVSCNGFASGSHEGAMGTNDIRALTDRFRPVALGLGWMAFGATAILAALGPIADPDLWWHLAAGRAMMATGAILRHDVFTHTLFGEPWIDFEWLAQLALYGVERMGGPWLLIAARAVLSVAVLALLITGVRSRGARGAALLVSAWVALAVLRPRFFVRPELATLVFFPFLVWATLRFLDGRESRRRFWALTAALFALWANLHGGFAYGLLWLGLAAVGAYLSHRAGAGHVFGGAAALGAAAACLNPWGPLLYKVFLIHAGQLESGAHIKEWAPTRFDAAPAFWGVFAAAYLALLWGIRRKKASARFWGPSLVAFSLLGAAHYRNAALFAFIALPAITAIVAAALRDADAATRRKLAASAAAAAALAIVLALPRIRTRLPAAAVPDILFPRGAAAFVRDNGIDGRMYNDYGDGGYLEWTLGPARLTFMDGRYLFHPFLRKLARFESLADPERGRAFWAEWFARHGVDHAIVPLLFLSADFAGGAAGLTYGDVMFPDDAWSFVYWDDRSGVFVKRGRKFERLIASAYRVLRPYNIERTLAAIRNGEGRAQLAAELARHERAVPRSVMRDVIERLARLPDRGAAIFPSKTSR